ncbi:MAG: ORF6N domain-containing protein [Zetaproteobacteria bacterium]|nr:ORF6N domain-containing protein [Zetaproteobacteria bacterium]
MSDTLEALPTPQIQSRIFTIRGQQVMLDRDLAEMYQVKPIRLREQVKRNIQRFPDDFMFQLSDDEVSLLLSQNAIPSRKQLGGALPYAFTEQGIASLSGVLKSATATEVHVQIMRAFVEMRRFIQSNVQLFARLDAVERRQITFETETTRNFEKILNALEMGEPVKQGIFFDGQVFDAYAFAADLIKSAKHSIVLIDNYVDESTLLLLSKRNKGCTATIYTHKISQQLQQDLEKHNAQYPPIEIRTYKQAHDRFLILDDKSLYHIGASLKDLGKKMFAFSRFEKGALKLLGRLSHA